MKETKEDKRLDLSKVKRKWIVIFVITAFFVIGLLKNIFKG